MSSRPELHEITPDNVGAAVRIEVKPEQGQFVAPVVYSLAEAYAQPHVAWPRLVQDGEQAVAFVMGAFDPSSDPDFFRSGIWRLNVGAEHQGEGYGRFAVESVLDEARRRGQGRATVLWVPGEGGPEGFWRHMGFEPTGEEFHGQIVGERYL
jgi:diamine N-acetyltransferase